MNRDGQVRLLICLVLTNSFIRIQIPDYSTTQPDVYLPFSLHDGFIQQTMPYWFSKSTPQINCEEIIQIEREKYRTV